MNATLYAMGLIQSSAGLMVAALIGVLFGLFLEQAGLGSSRKLTGVFYFRDMTVLKVLLTALLTTLLGYRYLVAFGWLSPDHIYFPESAWAPQIVAGLLFGAGFVLGGWCPGTAFVGMASAKLDALIFLVGAFFGSILFNELFFLVRPLYNAASSGPLFVEEGMGISQNLLVLLLCLFSVALFFILSRLERRRKGATLKPWKPHALGAAVLLAFAGGLFLLPLRGPFTASLPPKADRLERISAVQDYVHPLELAARMMQEGPDMMVVDLRSPDAYRLFHLRGAVNLTLDDLPRLADERLPRTARLVLYSENTVEAAQAGLELRHWGWTRVEILKGGLRGFWRECLTPPALMPGSGVPPTEEAWEAFTSRRDFFMEMVQR